jgi:integrase
MGYGVETAERLSLAVGYVMAAIKMTTTAVRKLNSGGEKQKIYTDAAGLGLVVYASQAGALLYKYRYRFKGGNPQYITIGDAKVMRYEDARAQAQYFDENKRIGFDPNMLNYARKRTASINDAIENYIEYLKARAPELRDENHVYIKNCRSLLRDLSSRYGNTELASFSRVNARNFLTENFGTRLVDAQKESGAKNTWRPGSGLKVIATAAQVWRRALDRLSGLDCGDAVQVWGDDLKSYISALRHYRPGSHAVAWTPSQRESIIAALESAETRMRGKRNIPTGMSPVSAIFLQMLLYTGARPSEIQSLRWDEVIEYRATYTDESGVCHDVPMTKIIKNIHKTEDKTRKPREIILSSAAIDVIEKARRLRAVAAYDGIYVFPTPNRNKTTKTPYIGSPNTATIHLSKMVGFTVIPYHFRSAYINHMAELLGEGAISAIAHNVGHSSFRTTAKYYRRLRDILVARQLHGAADMSPKDGAAG